MVAKIAWLQTNMSTLNVSDKIKLLQLKGNTIN